VLVSDTTTGILVFDVFATYIKTIPIKSDSHIKPIENNLYYFAEGMMHIYDQTSFKTRSFQVPDAEQVIDVSIEKSRLYIMRADRIEVFEF